VLGALLLLALLSGCASYPFTAIKPEGVVARQDDNLYEIVTIIAIGVFVIVGGLIVYSSLRFRRPRGAGDAEPRQVFGNTPLEMTWTVIPIVIVGLLFVLAVQTLQATTVPAATPKDAIVVDVIGHQWYWEYKYPQYGIDVSQANPIFNAPGAVPALYVPVHRTMLLNITSQDVQHGWWVPALAGKNEAIPGHTNRQEFIADTVGTYYAICTYFCGIQHYNMRASVVVESASAFAAWVAKNRPAATATPGPAAATATPAPAGPVSFSKDIEPLFAAHCNTCHFGQGLGGLNLSTYANVMKGGTFVKGQQVVVPGKHAASLLWRLTQANPALYPSGVPRMPLGGAGGYLTDAQVAAIAAWIDQGAKNN
jgi:cytochrome c oxidase subunit 2